MEKIGGSGVLCHCILFISTAWLALMERRYNFFTPSEAQGIIQNNVPGLFSSSSLHHEHPGL